MKTSSIGDKFPVFVRKMEEMLKNKDYTFCDKSTLERLVKVNKELIKCHNHNASTS